MTEKVFNFNHFTDVRNIETKVNNLLRWGFKPSKLDYMMFCNEYESDFVPLNNFNDWELDGEFICDNSPFDDSKNQKHIFTLKASLESDTITLNCWGEVWGDYAILNDRKYYPIFNKKRVLKDVKSDQERRQIKLLNDNPKGVIYLIRGDGFTKIGLTIRPFERLRTIGTKLPFEAVAIRHYILDKRSLKDIENKLHNFFSHKRTNGEWFNLSDDDVIFIDYLFTTGRMPTKYFDYTKQDFFIKYKGYVSKLKNINRDYSQ
jgi:hypothetical protein